MSLPNSPPPCIIIGIHADGWSGLTDAARQHLATAECVIGSTRALAAVSGWLAPAAQRRAFDGQLNAVLAWIRTAQQCGQRVVVLTNGDPLCHGLGERLCHQLGPTAVIVIPTLSTVQLACARLGRGWHQFTIASCHHATTDTAQWSLYATPTHGLYAVLRAVAQSPAVAVFTSPAYTPTSIAQALLTAGYDDAVQLTVAARLTYPDEILLPALPLTAAAARDFPQPNLVLIERLAGAPPLFGLPEQDFAHQVTATVTSPAATVTGLITKHEIRAVALAKLALRSDSVVWDIGAGSGAVGLEASRLCHAGHVWAVEQQPERAAQIVANARALCATNYTLVIGPAPAALAAWARPDAVFIGGGGAQLPAIAQYSCEQMRRGGRVVISLVTLERLTHTCAWLEQRGLTWELLQLSLARSQPVRGQQRLAALNPVWLLTITL